MHRAIPQSSKLLAKKWAQQDRDIHLRKLHEARASLDTINVPKHHHLYMRGKKDQILEGRRLLRRRDRFTEIDRENRILLEKMTNIQHKRMPPKAPSLPHLKKKSLNQGLRK